MNLIQRLILILGCVGILHTSMVPPVQQPEEGACRYHEFTLRSMPFTRTFSVNRGDVTALLAEYGIIVSATGVLFLLAGLSPRERREHG